MLTEYLDLVKTLTYCFNMAADIAHEREQKEDPTLDKDYIQALLQDKFPVLTIGDNADYKNQIFKKIIETEMFQADNRADSLTLIEQAYGNMSSNNENRQYEGASFILEMLTVSYEELGYR